MNISYSDQELSNYMHHNYLPVVLFTAFAVLFYGTWNSLFALWLKFDFAYSHGFLALGLSLLSAYQSRGTLRKSPPRPHTPFLLLLAACSLTWFAADFLQIQVGTQLLLVPLIYLTLAGIYGAKSAANQVPAMLYLLFTVPVWDYLSPVLQQITTSVSSLVLQSSGLAVFIEGNFISIPYGTFEIAGGCSGLRYLLVTLVLVLFYSQQRPNTLGTTLKLFLVAIFFGLLANWLRVIAIILIGYESEMQSEIVEDHEMFGWFVFMGVLIPALPVLNRIESHSLGQKNSTRDSEEAITPISTGTPEPIKNASASKTNLALGLALLALAIGPILKLVSTQANTKNGAEYAFNTTPPTDQWHAHNTSIHSWDLHYPGAKLVPPQTFKHSSGQFITVQAAFYEQERQGQELVNELNGIANEKVWTITHAPNKITLPSHIPVTANIIKERGGHRKLVFSYFSIGETKTNNKLQAKLQQLLAIAEPGTIEALVAYGIPCRTNCLLESSLLSNFLDAYEQLKDPVLSLREN